MRAAADRGRRGGGTRAAHRRRARGFTLIELLVAFTILALVLGASLRVLSDGLRAVRLADAHTRAVEVARSRLDELAASPELEPGTSAGTAPGAPGPDGLFRWEVTVTAYPGDDLGATDSVPLLPYWARVEVSWYADGRERGVDLATLLLGRRF